MTRQHEEFNCYCLDRCKPLSEEFTITYTDGSIIRKILYKIGLRASIKHVDCFCLYTESDDDIDRFLFISTEKYYEYQKRFFFDIFNVEDLSSIINSIKTINIFEFVSLLDFNNIYQDFKDYLEYNWSRLQMDELIEI